MGEVSGLLQGWFRKQAPQTLGAGAQTVTFSGLTGNTDGKYKVTGSYVGASGTSTADIKINGGATACLMAGFYGTGGGGATGAMTNLLWTDNGKYCNFWLEINAKANGQYRGGMCSFVVQRNSTDLYVMQTWFYWPNTADEITEIQLAGTSGNFFGSGGHFNIYNCFDR